MGNRPEYFKEQRQAVHDSLQRSNFLDPRQQPVNTIEMALAYQNAGELETAREWMERAVQEHPKVAMAWTNLAVLLFSSVTIQWSVISVKRQEMKMALFGLFLTFALGIIFLTGQWNAWIQMTNSGLPLVDQQRIDNSVSFFYIFTGLHGLHIVAGLVVLAVLLIQQIYGKAVSNPVRRKVAYELTAMFWHLLGVLWVYLFVFLLFTQT